MSRMPSASSTSADPDCEDAERFPFLTTRTPAPPATMADIVEMLTDVERPARHEDRGPRRHLVHGPSCLPSMRSSPWTRAVSTSGHVLDMPSLSLRVLPVPRNRPVMDENVYAHTP